jgi:ribosomal protein L11 methyltransferase
LPSLPDLRAAAGAALVEIATTETPDDWPQRWRRFHKPILIRAPEPRSATERRVPALHVRPPWEPPAELPGAAVDEIVIEPGQAFGTGAHATTRQCLQLMLSLAAHEAQPGPLIDLGTGSGVLAIAALRLGFSPVVAVDNDRESIAAASANAAVNRVRLELQRADLHAHASSWAAAVKGESVIVANLLRPLLLELAGALPHASKHLIAGGLLAEQLEEVVAAFSQRIGMVERERRVEAGWAAVWLCAR